MNQRPTSQRARIRVLDGERGARSRATRVVGDLDWIVAYTPVDASPADIARLVLDETGLGVRTATAGAHTVHKRVHLYGMHPELPVFGVFRWLWDQEPGGRSLLALRCVMARGPAAAGLGGDGSGGAGGWDSGFGVARGHRAPTPAPQVRWRRGCAGLWCVGGDPARSRPRASCWVASASTSGGSRRPRRGPAGCRASALDGPRRAVERARRVVFRHRESSTARRGGCTSPSLR